MCDRHFQVSYLVKYIAGSEEHQLADETASMTMEDVSVGTEEHAHEKITSCRKVVEKKLSEKQFSATKTNQRPEYWKQLFNITS